MKPKIFLTGSTGFLGKYLKNTLIKKGYSLVCLCRNNLEDSKDKSTIITATDEDFFSKNFLKKAINKCDAIIHLAGIADNNYINNQSDIDELFKINEDFTIKLFTAAQESNIKKFIFMSTIKVCGEYTEEEPFTENTLQTINQTVELDNRLAGNPYVKSKIKAENTLIRNYHDSGDSNYQLLNIIRPPIIYGEGVKGNIKTLIRTIQKGFPLPTSILNEKRSMISIYNLTDLIVNILKSELTGVIKSCCKDIDISTCDLVRKIAISLDKSRPDFYTPAWLLKIGALVFNKTEMMNKLTKPLLVNDKKTRERFNWEPSLSFEKGMKKTIDSLIN